jgi:hypothetical protein
MNFETQEEMEAEVQRLRLALAQKERENKALLAEKEAALAEKEAALAEKDAALAEKRKLELALSLKGYVEWLQERIVLTTNSSSCRTYDLHGPSPPSF